MKPSLTTKIETTCDECGKTYSLDVNTNHYNDWINMLEGKIERKCIQDVFPELTSAERELHFQSGICGTCWDELFSSDEEDEDEE